MKKIKNNLSEYKNILIKSGKIIDPVRKKEFDSDVFIKEGRISKIDKKIDFKNLDIADKNDIFVIDASGFIVSPGFVDMHVHLRDPGNEDEEDIKSGVSAALKGGVTAIACMPNTEPSIDSEHLVKYIIESAAKLDYKIFPIAAMTKKIKGKEITEFGILKRAGAIALSDDGRCVANSRIMYEIMEYARQFKLLLILHEEDYSFSEYGLAHEGYFSSKLGLDGISYLSEDLIVARDIMLAKYTDARIHITHVSSKNSVKMIKKAKENDVNVTCDVTPHHLFFNDSCLSDFNTNFKVKPPIRSEEDREAIIAGIKEGVIDAVASDHAPHLETEKNTTFKEASFGAIGLETLFSACYTKLYKQEGIKLPDVISLFTSSPSNILDIESGSLKIGNKADITIFNPDKINKIRKQDFISKSVNSPFIGESLFGEVVYTINNGKLVFKSG